MPKLNHVLFFTWLYNPFFCLIAQLPLVDFDTSMGKNHPRYHHYYQTLRTSQKDMKVFDILRALYKKNNPRTVVPQLEPRIPKIIHQIWLGSPVPEKFKIFQQTWREHNPDWEFKLWTDDDIAQLGLKNQEWYDKAINYAERSDIARYEILYRFGGVYVDIDFECVQPLEYLNHRYDFYAGIELPAMAPFLGYLVMINNALIASVPGHPILKRCIETIKKHHHHKDIIYKTGPIHFTQAFFDAFEQGDFINIALPVTYFYPIAKDAQERNEIEALIKPETYGIHHWAGSWIFNPDAFIPGVTFKMKVTTS